MSQNPEEQALAAIRQAEELMAQADRMTEDQDQKMRAAGLDPAQVRAIKREHLDDAHRSKLDAMLNGELETIERDARHATEQQDNTTTRTRKPRNMV